MDDSAALLNFASSLRTNYPLSEVQDLYKSLYQDHFGPGHIISNWNHVRQNLVDEIEALRPLPETRLTEACGPSGKMIRLNLRSALQAGIDADTIIFFMQQTVERLQPDTTVFLQTWHRIRQAAADNRLPWSAEEIEILDHSLGPARLKVLHHSEAYKNTYMPAYRVILAEVFLEWQQRNNSTD